MVSGKELNVGFEDMKLPVWGVSRREKRRVTPRGPQEVRAS